MRDFVVSKSHIRGLFVSTSTYMLKFWVILSIVNSLYIYYFLYPTKVWGERNKYVATSIAETLKAKKDYTSLFLTSPKLYPDFGTLNFIAPETNKIEVNDPDTYEFTDTSKKIIYIFYPNYYQKYKEARRFYKNEKFVEIYIPSYNKPSAYLVIVN